MGRPPRSPLLGYNHNVRYRGRVFHVQTEDSGPANPRLFTHLYYQGTIVASMRHDYDREASEELVRSLMQGQHKAILKELKQAKHDERISAHFATRGEALDEVATDRAPDQKALDLDALPPLEEVEAELESSESLESEAAAVAPLRMPPGPGVYALTRAARPDRPTPPPVPSVVVQRSVSVGGAPPVPQIPPHRARRPAAPLPGARTGGPALPPPLPFAPPPVHPADAPRTSAVKTDTPPVEIISDKSLDEVILAYLSQDERDRQP